MMRLPLLAAALLAAGAAAAGPLELSVPDGSNGVRILTGGRPAAEAMFEATLRAGVAPPRRIDMLRNSAYVVAAAPGETVALDGPADLAAEAEPVSFPQDRAAILADAATTETLAVDRSTIPLWAPRAAHVLLPAGNSAIRIVGDGQGFVVFVAERHPGGAWSPARFEPVMPGGSTIFCARREVALARDADAPLAVAAPAGATFGTERYREHLPAQTPATQTIAVADSAGLSAAIAAAVSGTAIELAPGTYQRDAGFAAGLWTANAAVGRRGGEGVTIRGTGNSPAEVVVLPSAGASASWLIDQTGTSAALRFENLTIDTAGSTCTAWLRGGRFELADVRILGPRRDTGDLLQVGPSATAPVFADFLFCEFLGSSADVFSGVGNNSAFAATSRVRLFACRAASAGPATTHQALTTHTNLPIEAWGGDFAQATRFVMAPDSRAGSLLRCFFVRTEGGSLQGVTTLAGRFGYAAGTTITPKDGSATLLTTPRGGLLRPMLPEGFLPAAW